MIKVSTVYRKLFDLLEKPRISICSTKKRQSDVGVVVVWGRRGGGGGWVLGRDVSSGKINFLD